MLRDGLRKDPALTARIWAMAREFERSVRPYYGEDYNEGRVPESFGEGYGTDRHWRNEKRWRASAFSIDEVIRTLGARSPILEIGCGRGVMTGYLREIGYQTIGLDITDDRTPPGPTVQASALALPVKRNSIGVLVALDVVEHVPIELQSVLIAQFWQALRVDGILIITVPTELPHYVLGVEAGPRNHYVVVGENQWRSHFHDNLFREAMGTVELVALGPPFSYGRTNFPFVFRRDHWRKG